MCPDAVYIVILVNGKENEWKENEWKDREMESNRVERYNHKSKKM